MQTPKYAIALQAEEPEDSLICTFSDDTLWEWLNDAEAQRFARALSAGAGNSAVPFATTHPDVIWSSAIPGLDPRQWQTTTPIAKDLVCQQKAKALCFLVAADGRFTDEEHPLLTRVRVYDEMQFEDELAELNVLLGEDNVYESDL